MDVRFRFRVEKSDSTQQDKLCDEASQSEVQKRESRKRNTYPVVPETKTHDPVTTARE